MKATRLTTWAGVIWAVACLLALPVILFGLPHWEKALAGLPFMKISEKYAGGPVLKTVDHGAYKTVIHQPVFPALIGTGRTGFVQVNWTPLMSLPPVISEDIDYSFDGQPDLSITIDTKSGRTEVKSLRDSVPARLSASCALSDSWVVRVDM
jgi:hypothetical protein